MFIDVYYYVRLILVLELVSQFTCMALSIRMISACTTAIFDFGFGYNGFPYMSPYTIKNYFFKRANCDATWILLLENVIQVSYSFIGVLSKYLYKNITHRCVQLYK